ncbi:MAG: hypothetical protein HC883_05635 [Bdellovibrionaceae bacterium]|nr:hypothetical protein [Pseudobdellovibrionaceae bacterium]
MNWPLTKQIRLLTALSGALWMLGCGVKGDPLPPEKPVELGRGRPTYKRATEGIPIEKSKLRKEDADEKDEDNNEESE